MDAVGARHAAAFLNVKPMPVELAPATAAQLREALRDAAGSGQPIELGGNFSKRTMGGEVAPANVVVSTRALTGVLSYEPKDLTISVAAGMKFRDLAGALAANRQMLPLDPPYFEEASVGGVVASNCSGPRRRKYGTARDMVIGMKFCTLAGKEIQSGGMVVKNVTGLDMAKLLIGSFGTLACIASVNFKVFPCPEEARTFGLSSDALDDLLGLRRELVGGALQPTAIDLLNSEAARHLGFDLPARYSLLVEVSGNRAMMDRCRREFEQLALAGGGVTLMSLAGEAAGSLWRSIRELTPVMQKAQPSAVVLRVSGLPGGIGQIVRAAGQRAVLVRAGAAVGYIYCSDAEDARGCLAESRGAGLNTVVEHAPRGQREGLESWAQPGSEIEIMRLIKQRFDPNLLLNRGRMFDQI
jgi:glycolate oxidase FAD binding subunit